MTAVVLLVGAAVASPAGAQSSADGEPAASPVRMEAALLTAMNDVRVTRGRPPLRPVPTLRRAARGHSSYLRAIGVLDHEGRDGSPFWARIVAAGFPRGRSLGENLAMVPGCTPAAARRVVGLWMNSAGHRANLLNPRFRYVGTGVAAARGCSEAYVTADYGS